PRRFAERRRRRGGDRAHCSRRCVAPTADRQRIRHRAAVHARSAGRAYARRGERQLAGDLEAAGGGGGELNARICFVLPSLKGGGAERAAVHVLNNLATSRWQRSMFLFSRTGPYLDEVDPAIAITEAEGAGRREQWRSLRDYVARTRPHLVVSFLSYFSVLTA